MKPGLTLLETLIALLISTLLFQTIFQLTQLSFTESRLLRQSSSAMIKELEILHRYDEELLEGRRIPFPIKVSSMNQSPAYTEFKSVQGYIGVVLP